MSLHDTVYKILHKTLYRYKSESFPGQLIFSTNIPRLNESESTLLSHIVSSSHLRPKCYLKRSTNEYTGFEDLLIPVEYRYYSELFNKQNYYKARKSLVSKQVLFETDYGMLMNHSIIPFKNTKTMNYLVKMCQVPLPPVGK